MCTQHFVTPTIIQLQGFVWLLLYAHRQQSILGAAAHIILFVLVIALRPQTPTHFSGWSHYADVSEPVDSNGAQDVVTVQSGFRTRDLSITGPTRLPPALTEPTCHVTLLLSVDIEWRHRWVFFFFGLDDRKNNENVYNTVYICYTYSNICWESISWM
jgi:hypothetical protein